MARSDAVWSAQGTTPDAIEDALRELLVERHAENDRFVPARVLNMIAFVDRQWSGEIANRLRGVGRYHASRLVVLSYEPARTRLDARVTIVSDDDPRPDELALLHETVIVEIGDCHLDDLLSIADPLVVSDLPTLLWSPHGHQAVVDSLLGLAQAVLVDLVEESDRSASGERGAIERARELSDQAYVIDLAWLRSLPWRERVAATFDPVQLRPELWEITRVRVSHHPISTVAAMLFIGWLGSRLGWELDSLHDRGKALTGKARADGRSVALRLESAPEQLVPGLEGLTLETTTGRQIGLDRGPGGLRACEHYPDGEERRWVIPGASRGETGILGEGIRQALLRDPTYQPALLAAQKLVPAAER
jgi:glucose-6-phosphate dehydrogenase assembly protein OpcA